MIFVPPVCPVLATLLLATAPAEALEPRTPAIEAAFPLEPLYTAQRVRHAWDPKWLLQLGAHQVDGSYDSNQASKFSSDTLLSADFVLYNWQEEMGIGLEGGLWMNSYDAKIDATTTETVDTLRVLLGVRVADRGPDNPIWIPYARAGVMYRMDDGKEVSDSDLGWYAGGGIDFRFGSRIALTPQILYSESPSLNSQEWLLGLCLSIAF